jgi:hypothetical protein
MMGSLQALQSDLLGHRFSMPAAMAEHHMDCHPQNNRNFIKCGQWTKVYVVVAGLYVGQPMACVAGRGTWTRSRMGQ